MKNLNLNDINMNSNKNNIFHNPNFKYNSTILNNSGPFYGYNDIFEIYTNQKINESFLASQDNKTNNINIIYLSKKKLIKNLTSHDSNILSIKYFINISKKDEYLISNDKSNKVIIWDINNNYIIKFCLYQIYISKNNFIYSCLLLFNINEKNQNILVTTCGGIVYKRDHNSFTKIFFLENMKNVKNIKNIKRTNDNNTIYAINWKNKINGNYYIIEFCYHKISINNLSKNELGYELYNKNTNKYFYFCGFLYYNKEINNNDLLITTSTNGYIEIWDLINKNLIKYLYLKGYNIKNSIQWNERYIIVVESNRYFLIIDIFNLKVISKISGLYTKNILCVKKIKDKKYDECLVSCGYDNCIHLWCINNY